MTQTQIVQTLAEKCEVTKKISKAMTDCLAQTAIAEVKENGIFLVPGIGRLMRVAGKRAWDAIQRPASRLRSRRRRP